MATTDVIRDTADTLVDLFRARIPSTVVAAADVFVATPDELRKLIRRARPTITIFPYRLGVDAQAQNARPGVPPDGRAARRLTLDVGFLVTPWAKDPRAELVLAGRVLQVLYDHPRLGSGQLTGSSWSAEDDVHLTLDPLPLRDQVRIWETAQIPYRLSLVCSARVIGLDPA